MSYQKVIDLLASTKEQVSTLLPERDNEHHRLKIESALQKLTDYLALLTNTVGPETAKPASPGPATTIAGQPIPTRNNVKPSDLEPHAEKVAVLRRKVEELYPQFLNIESLDLLRNYDENLIRGVAKKAKMKVTKEDPESITLDFIEEVKENIREMEKRDESMNNLRAQTIDVPTAGDVSPETVTNSAFETIVDNDAVIEEEPQTRGRRNRK